MDNQTDDNMTRESNMKAGAVRLLTRCDCTRVLFFGTPLPPTIHVAIKRRGHSFVQSPAEMARMEFPRLEERVFVYDRMLPDGMANYRERV